MRSKASNLILIFGSIFLSVVGSLLALGVVFFLIRLFFGVLSYLPWITYLYMVMILLFPSILFISVYIIFLKRTLKYHAKLVRWISIVLFVAAILSWIYVVISDFSWYLQYGRTEIANYYSFNIVFLFINVVIIFSTGILQALSMPAERDWLEKRKEKYPDEI